MSPALHHPRLPPPPHTHTHFSSSAHRAHSCCLPSPRWQPMPLNIFKPDVLLWRTLLWLLVPLFRQGELESSVPGGLLEDWVGTFWSLCIVQMLYVIWKVMRLTPHRPSPVVDRFILAREKKERKKMKGKKGGGGEEGGRTLLFHLIICCGELVNWSFLGYVFPCQQSAR